jgi:hypothetical protein
MTTFKALAMLAACSAIALPGLAVAQSAPAIPPSIVTPDRVDTRLGTLEFKDGAPSAETVTKIYDNLDFTHAFDALLNTAFKTGNAEETKMNRRQLFS